MWPGLFSGPQGAREEGRGLPTSEKAWAKAPAVEPLPPEMDKELVRWLQDEEIVVERMRQGQDAAILTVVRETTGTPMTEAYSGFTFPHTSPSPVTSTWKRSTSGAGLRTLKQKSRDHFR